MRVICEGWSAALIIHPVVGIVGAVVARIGARTQPPIPCKRLRPWLLVWAPLLVLGLFQAAVDRDATHWLLIQGLGVVVVGIIFSFAPVPRWTAMLVGLLILSLLSGLEVRVNHGLWGSNSRLVYASGGLAARLESGHGIQGEPLYAYFSQAWTGVSATNAYLLQLDYRLVSGIVGWEWYRYNREFVMTPYVDEAGRVVTKVDSPPSEASLRYITREVNTGESLAGRRFRAQVEIRTEEPGSIEPCKGVTLQENGGNYHGECLEVRGGDEFVRYEVEFLAPLEATSEGIRLVLGGMAGTFETIGGSIDEFISGEWVSLGPPQPIGLGVWPPLEGARRHDTFSVRSLPRDDWQELAMIVPAGKASPKGELVLSLQLEGGATIDVRNVKLTPLNESVVAPEPMGKNRTQLWYGHPNLLGHTLAASGLLVMGGATTVVGTLLAFLATFVAVSFTASRTAAMAVSVGVLLLLMTLRTGVGPGNSRYRRRVLVIVGAVAVMGATYLPGPSNLIDRLRLASNSGSALTPRSEIWQVAFEMLSRHPLKGVSANGGFASNWPLLYTGPSTERVTHAHNFWLQFGAEYGVPGLTAALLVAAALLWLAWVFGQWRGLALVVPFLLLQVFDFTLFYSGVLFPLAFSLNLLRGQSGQGRRMLCVSNRNLPERTSREAGCTSSRLTSVRGLKSPSERSLGR